MYLRLSVSALYSNVYGEWQRQAARPRGNWGGVTFMALLWPIAALSMIFLCRAHPTS